MTGRRRRKQFSKQNLLPIHRWELNPMALFNSQVNSNKSRGSLEASPFLLVSLTNYCFSASEKLTHSGSKLERN